MGLVPDLAAQRAQLSPDALAFTDYESGETWDFARVNAEASRIAATLLQHVDAGARVAILCQNRPEFFVILFACQKAGLILAPLNWRQPAAELQPVVASINCSLVLHDDSFSAEAAALGLPSLSLNDLSAQAASAVPLPIRAIDAEAVWYVLFTSGTTGTPKAVIQTARMVTANAMNIAQNMGLLAQDRTVNFLPLFHTAGINLFTMPLFLWGGASLVLRSFDAETLLALIKDRAITQFFGVPAIYQELAKLPLEGAHLDELRGWACGGAALPEALIAHFAAKGAVICNGFGMTETGPTGFLIDAAAALTRIGSVGKPQMMTEARLQGVEDGMSGTGELLLRGPTVTPGYLDNPLATEAAFTEDGWLRSGDVATRDEDGYYRIVDRIKDMYISGGENVFPAEVERVLITHPQIAEAAVIGVPDAKWGESGIGFLVPKSGEALDQAALCDWLRARIAAYKIPREFRIVEAFPRTPAGKVRKPELRKLVP
ncbi:class I adenylate-forming enzyme family protein [Pararhodobacter oceanensis]|uniref:3-methylmercaptopropionyl-CoA ligase n=1 Tax=Pararhodobacter oceanensis TaxID=2172121 RepID=A0A2T8HQV3_9RHOB|nr:AMP-binding protein [Pararhodobacter oceanensis]PVH27837.1 acid--CoA ligase [Pararhodobacter oceanensis]